MNLPSRARLFTVLVGMFATALVACGSSTSSPPAPAGCADKVGALCVGAPEASVCAGDACTADVTCASVIKVTTSAQLESALATATAGACLALAAGNYGNADVPAGVSLLGTGANAVTLASVRINGGKGSTIRGLTVKGGGVFAKDAQSLAIDRVKIVSGATFGLYLLDSDGAVSASTISGNSGNGIIAICKSACDARPKVSFSGVLAKDNETAGLLVRGVTVEFNGMLIRHTKAKAFFFGRGIDAAAGATLSGKALQVDDSEDIGIFLEGGSITLDDLHVSRNVRGIHLRKVTGGRLSTFELRDNKAVGLGVDAASVGIVVEGGIIAGTKSVSTPSDIGGEQSIGDGVNWLHGSAVKISASVRIENSGRRAVIADLEARGEFSGSLAGGDEMNGIVVEGGITPSLPSDLKIGSGIKIDLRSKADALPLAAAAASASDPKGP